MKDWMIEQQALEDSGAKIEFVCPSPNCENWIEHFEGIPTPHLMAEKQSDIESTENFDIWCSDCGTTFSARITNDSAFVSVEIEDYPDLDIEVTVPDFDYPYEDPYEDYLPPDDPFSVALEALGHLKDMVGSQSPTNDPQFTNRLIFSGAISTIEAYLSDTLINSVQNMMKFELP